MPKHASTLSTSSCQCSVCKTICEPIKNNLSCDCKIVHDIYDDTSCDISCDTSYDSQCKSINNISNDKNDKKCENETQDPSELIKKLAEILCKIFLCMYNYSHKLYSTILLPILKKNQKYFRLKCNSDYDLKYLKKYMKILPLVPEIYCMLCQVFLIRTWFMLNFFCSILQMYDNLSDVSIKNRLIPICTNDIKKLSYIVIFFGIVLILFVNSISIFTILLMLYLINRTLRNIFNKGV